MRMSTFRHHFGTEAERMLNDLIRVRDYDRAEKLVSAYLVPYLEESSDEDDEPEYLRLHINLCAIHSLLCRIKFGEEWDNMA